ncbi:sterol desaturase family protein [Caballeronia glebae]|nr:sterol desaturase family protein [Caballeronia glebae]
MALPLLGMVACVLAELYFTHHRKGREIPWRDVIFNLDSGHILMWLLRGFEIAVFAWVLQHVNLHWVDGWHPAVVWVFALLAWDLGFYWMHRLHHVFSALWAVHVVHHEGEHFNLSLGIRNGWLSSLTTLPFTTIPLALAGVSVEVFVAVSTLHYTVQFYNHNGVVKNSGWLEHVFVTPAHHRVHHGHNPEYRDRNFGGTFLLWDKLFGSFQAQLPTIPVKLGIAKPIKSTNPFWANIAPLLRLVGMPTPALAEGKSVVSPFLIGMGGLVLFGLVAYYIHRDGTWPGQTQWVLFTLIFLGTLALGGMSDGRAWGLPCWIGIGVTAALLLPLAFGLRDPVGLFALAAFPLHGIVTAAGGLAQGHTNK